MTIGTNHNTVQIARQHTRRILNGFAASQLQVTVREEKRLPAKLVHTNFKGNSGARRGFFKNHAQSLTFEQMMFNPCLLLGLQLMGQSQNLLYFIHG